MRSAALTLLILALTLALAAGGPVPAADKDDKPAEKADKALDAGLKPGKDEIGGPFRPFNVTGKEKHRSRFHDLVSEHGLDPVVLVFVRGVEPGDFVMDLLQKLEALAAKNERSRLAVVAVFLTDDVKDLVKDDAKREDAAGKVMDKVGKVEHVAAAVDVPADVKDAYKLNDDAEVTVMLYNKFRVETNRAFAAGALNEAGVGSVVDEIKGKLDALRGTTAAKPAPK
jgi:hypothetical protein